MEIPAAGAGRRVRAAPRQLGRGAGVSWARRCHLCGSGTRGHDGGAAGGTPLGSVLRSGPCPARFWQRWCCVRDPPRLVSFSEAAAR